MLKSFPILKRNGAYFIKEEKNPFQKFQCFECAK
jgi:hypothetical protein